MNEVTVTVGGKSYNFPPESTITIGRSPDSDIIVDDPYVSRQHARLSWNEKTWVLANMGRGQTFLGGQPIANTPVTQTTDFHLGSPAGSIMRVDPFIPPTVFPPPAETPITTAPPGAPHARDTGMLPGTDLTKDNVHTRATEGELATAWQLLVPIKSWLNNPGWRQGLRLLIIPYALLPLIFLEIYSTSTDPTAPGKAYSVYIAPLWTLAFWFLIRPGRITKQVIQVATGIAIFVYIWMQKVTSSVDTYLGDLKSLPAAIGVGINEEVSKALPILIVAVIILKTRKAKWDPRMWMFLGTISGLTFGVIESWLYTKRSIAGLIISHYFNITSHHSGIDVGAAINATIEENLSFASRVFVDGFQHAIWAGIAGFFIGMGINYSRRRVELIAFGIAIPALLHGLNDWMASISSSLWPCICINAFSLILFLGYTMSAHLIDRGVRRSPIFRGESILVDDFSDSKMNHDNS